MTPTPEQLSIIDLARLDEVMEWARKVRRGEVPATPEERDRAKTLTFVETYSMGPQKMRKLDDPNS